MNLSISPGKNNVGAYINDINLKSLDQDQATEIKKILNKYGVIFIKEQNLDPETYQLYRSESRWEVFLIKSLLGHYMEK